MASGVMSAASFQLLPCATAGIEAVAASTARTLARHSHEQFGIGAMRSGAHRSHSGRGQVEAAAGNAITVNPGEVHDGAPIGDGGRAWSMLYLDPAIIAQAAEEVFCHRGARFEFTRPVIADPRVSAAFWALYAAETGSTDCLRREELLLALVARAGRPAVAPPAASTAPVAAARQRIDDDPVTPVGLAELAALSGISRFQLIRGFSRATGLTPHAYLLQRRTDLARRLIGEGASLAEAAAAAGFSDQSHMTRTFVRKFGISPGRFAAAR